MDELFYPRFEKKMDLIIKLLALIWEASLKAEDTFAFDPRTEKREKILKELHEFLEGN